jgi:hypothetical protein
MKCLRQWTRYSLCWSATAVLLVIRIADADFVAELILVWVLKPEELGMFYSSTSLAVVAGIVSTQGISGSRRGLPRVNSRLKRG